MITQKHVYILDNGSFFALSAFKYWPTFNGGTKLRLGKMGFGNYENSFNGAVKSGHPLYTSKHDNITQSV